MTAKSGKMTGGAAGVIPNLVIENAQAGIKQVLNGGKETKTISWWQ